MGLNEQGFYSLSFVPNRPIESGRPEDIWRAVLPQLEASVHSDRLNIFAFSVNTHDYYKLPPLIARLKENFPGALFVAGGPHFVREQLVDASGKPYRDTVQIGLDDGLDVVFTGHCQSFIEFICRYAAKIGEAEARGLFHSKNRDQIVGVKRSVYPRLLSVPRLKFAEGNGIIETITENACSHGCGICSANKGRLGFTRKVLYKSLLEMVEAVQYGHIGFYNINTFLRKNPLLLELLEKIEAPGDFITTKNASFDPSLLLDPGALATIKRAINIGFNDFFVGAETASPRIAQLIGIRGHRGKIKDKACLEAEEKALINFIELLKRQLGNPLCYFRVTLSYVITPFETATSIQRMFDQMERYLSLASYELDIAANVIPLAPFPGTQVRRDFVHLLEDPERFRFFDYDYYWDWKNDLGQQLHLLDQFAQRGMDRYRRGNVAEAATVNRALMEEAFSDQQRLASAEQREHLFDDLTA